MKQQIKTQIYLMFSQKFIYIIGAIVICLSLSLEIVSYFAAETLNVPTSDFTGFASLVSGISDFSTTEIFCAVIAALFFGTEIKNRSINIALCAGVSRRDYWLSKYIVFIIAGFIIAVLYPLTLCVFATVTYGFGAVAGVGALYFLRLFLIYFTSVAATVSIYAVFSAIFSSTSAIVFSSLGFMFVSKIIMQIIPIFIKGSETVIGLFPSNSVAKITAPDLSLSSGLTITIINIAAAVGLFVVSYLIFKRKELK
jgi:ABC-type transport system involved in multi-copper enzyme maturation permease subunit